MPPIPPMLCLAARVGRHRVDSRESAAREVVPDGDVLPVARACKATRSWVRRQVRLSRVDAVGLGAGGN